MNEHGVVALVLEQGGDVDEVEGGEMVEMDEVGLNVVCAEDEVSHEAAVVWWDEFIGHFLGEGGGHTV